MGCLPKYRKEVAARAHMAKQEKLHLEACALESNNVIDIDECSWDGTVNNLLSSDLDMDSGSPFLYLSSRSGKDGLSGGVMHMHRVWMRRQPK